MKAVCTAVVVVVVGVAVIYDRLPKEFFSLI